MLSITIFATIVGEMLPVSDATPLIGQSHPELADSCSHIDGTNGELFEPLCYHYY